MAPRWTVGTMLALGRIGWHFDTTMIARPVADAYQGYP